MPEEDDDGEDGYGRGKEEGCRQGVYGALNELSPVVERGDPHARRKTLFQLSHLRLNGVDDPKRVLAELHEHHAARHLDPLLVESTATEVGPNGDVSDVLHIDRHTLVGADHDVLDVGGCLDEPHAAHHKLHPALLEHLGAHVEVASLHRHHHV